MNSLIARLVQRLRTAAALPADDLLRDATYRRLWTSILISSLGGQVTMLALPLTAAVLLHATPTQMGLLTAMEIAPFVLLSLPCGVWLDRVRKLPVYVAGEASLALIVASVPAAWWLGWLGMPWMYMVGFVMGCVHVVAGSAAQIVLTQVVARERLVEAHAKNALAGSGAEVAGPGVTLVDSAEVVAEAVARGLAEAGLEAGAEGSPTQHLCVTDSGETFHRVAGRILGDSGVSLEWVEVV